MDKILDKYKINGYIVVGVSAGPDSMCLLHLLENQTDKLVVCHINHKIRKESDEEETYLKNYCKEHNLIFEEYTIKEYNEHNFENEARKKRYAFYEKTLNKYHSKYLFLAHHGDDLIETVLMKIVRGSNLEGYAGIKETSHKNSYYIIRPLLKYTKNDILEYNQKHHIKYFLDYTNNCNDYTRNRYRNTILPLLKEEDKNIHKKFLRYSKILNEYDEYIKYLVKKSISKIYIDKVINLDELNKLDSFLIKNTIYYIINNIYDNKANIINENLINNILSIINNKKPNQTLNLPNNKILVKKYNKIYFKENDNNFNNDFKIIFKDKLIINNIIFTKEEKEESDNNYICRLNSSNITFPLFFRNRKKGDKIILKGSNYHKKIKEIFIENKVPKENRDTYPILVDKNDNIIWLPGLKKSIFCIKKDENNQNYDIIIKASEREE